MLVTGSRTYGRERLANGTLGEELPNLGLVHDVLLGLYINHDTGFLTVHAEHFYVRHGFGRGADTHAHNWIKAGGVHPGDRRITEPDVCSVVEEKFPADWEKYGKRAGYLRNDQMLHAPGKIDLVLAFIDKPLQESKGTAMMVGMIPAHIPVHIISDRGGIT